MEHLGGGWTLLYHLSMLKLGTVSEPRAGITQAVWEKMHVLLTAWPLCAMGAAVGHALEEDAVPAPVLTSSSFSRMSFSVSESGTVGITGIGKSVPLSLVSLLRVVRGEQNIGN